MRFPRLVLLVAALPLLIAPASGQFTSMEGDWWLTVTGDKGAMVLTFSEEEGSSFEVTGGGFSTRFGTFYAVSDDAPQELFFDFAGKISGTIELEDYSNLTPLGTLDISTGRVDELYEWVRLSGTLTLSGGEPRRIVVRGSRVPATKPNWTGKTHRARLSGRGVRSSKYDLSLAELPTVGFPFFALTGEGSVRLDGEPQLDVQTGGVLLATPKGKLYGEVLFDESDTIARGRVRSKDGADPRLNLKARAKSEERSIRFAGTLDMPATLPIP